MACHHGRWCDRHIVAHMRASDDCRPLMGEAMLRLMRQGFKPMIELADSLRPIAIEVIETCRRLYHEFAESMGDMYDEAGRPYGDDEAEMWKWVGEQVDTPWH